MRVSADPRAAGGGERDCRGSDHRPSAAAQEPARLVDITLTSIKPALPTRDGTITLTGQVRNISDQRLVRLRALFWRNEAPITSREGLDKALNSASNDPLGRRLFNQDFQDLYTDDDPYLEPNKSVGFRIKVDVADLALSGDDGVYLMGVHVLQDTANVAIGRSRIFVPLVAARARPPAEDDLDRDPRQPAVADQQRGAVR